jgi:hypothetical protein
VHDGGKFDAIAKLGTKSVRTSCISRAGVFSLPLCDPGIPQATMAFSREIVGQQWILFRTYYFK